MNRYQLDQGFVITDENNIIEKECHLSLLVSVEEMKRGRILKLFHDVVEAYGNLLKEERKQYEAEEEEWRKRFQVEKEIREQVLQQREQGGMRDEAKF